MRNLVQMAATLAFTAAVGACGASNYEPAKATVESIDRTCSIVETTTEASGRKTARGYEDDCKSIEAWEDARAKRDKTIAGSAVVKVTYMAPADGAFHTAELHFKARDDEFYDLKAGEEVDILVNKTDPQKIRKA